MGSGYAFSPDGRERAQEVSDLKDNMPSWPQMLVIAGFAVAALICAYCLSSMRSDGVSVPAILPVLLALAVAGFAASMFFFYFRPQYGGKSFRSMAAFFLGHVVLVALLWKIGVLG